MKRQFLMHRWKRIFNAQSAQQITVIRQNIYLLKLLWAIVNAFTKDSQDTVTFVGETKDTMSGEVTLIEWIVFHALHQKYLSAVAAPGEPSGWIEWLGWAWGEMSLTRMPLLRMIKACTSHKFWITNEVDIIQHGHKRLLVTILCCRWVKKDPNLSANNVVEEMDMWCDVCECWWTQLLESQWPMEQIGYSCGLLSKEWWWVRLIRVTMTRYCLSLVTVWSIRPNNLILCPKDNGRSTLYMLDPILILVQCWYGTGASSTNTG